MPPIVASIPQRDPRSPAVLPRDCGTLVRFRFDGWPVALVIPTDCGLLDPSCGYWHGIKAANADSGPPAQAGA